MKKHSYILFTGLFFLFSQCSNPGVPIPKNPLETCESCNTWIENKLIDFLDRTLEAKRYWLSIEDRPWYRCMTRPLYHWVSFSWRTEIHEHMSHLEDLQVTLAVALGKLISNDPEEINKIQKNMYNITLKATSILKRHGIPFHIKRNWMFYIGASVACYQMFKVYQNYINTHVNLIIKRHYDPQVTAALRDSQYPHTVTRENMGITITSLKEHVEEFKEKLSSHQLTTSDYAIQEASIYDLRRALLDENGQFLITTLLYTCLINPIKNIASKLKRDRATKNNDYSLEQKEQDAALTKAELITLLNHAAQHPAEYPTIAEALKQYGSFEGLPIARLEDLRKPLDRAFIEYIKDEAKDLLPQLIENLSKKDSNNWGSWFAAKATHFLPTDPNLQQSVGFYAYRYWLAWFQEQFPAIQYNITTFLSALEFLTESFKTTPIWFSLYLGRKSIKDVNQWRRNHYFKEPLRYDIKDFINFLDENIYTHLTNPTFKGLHYYWTVRLKRYKSFMTNKDRIYFEKDLEKLTRGTTVNHEIETLRALLYHEIEHF